MNNIIKNKKCKCGRKATAIIGKNFVCQKCYNKKKIRQSPFSKNSWLDKYVDGEDGD